MQICYPTLEISKMKVSLPNLSSALSSAELSAFDEPGVPVGSDDPVVQPGAVDVLHGVGGILAQVVLHEAEAARSALELVETLEMNQLPKPAKSTQRALSSCSRVYIINNEILVNHDC